MSDKDLGKDVGIDFEELKKITAEGLWEHRYPNQCLRRGAMNVKFDDQTTMIAKEMVKVMYQVHAYGLAAPQFGVGKNIIVYDVSEHRDHPRMFANVSIEDRRGVLTSYSEEACLSIKTRDRKMPHGKVIRKENIVFNAWDISGGGMEITGRVSGKEAFVIQHEVDHLMGKLFFDHMNGWERDQFLKKFYDKENKR